MTSTQCSTNLTSKCLANDLERLAAACGLTVPELQRVLQSVLDSFTSETSREKELNEILSKRGFEDEATGETE